MRFYRISAVGGFFLLVLSFVLSADETGNTSVFWGATSCWTRLEVHGPVDLGTFTGPDEVLQDEADNIVRTNTNCKNGYQLTVHPTRITRPEVNGTGPDVLADFQWRVVGAPPNPHCTNQQSSYPGSQFSGLGPGNAKNVGNCTVPANSSAHAWNIGYRYTTDDEDLPGNYEVFLTYTLVGQN
jgi:hypothetical protein